MSLEIFSLESIQEIASQYGYIAVFIGIALENTGIPLPGETITLVGGFLAGSGELNYWLVLLSAISGAVIGDNFGYWIGRWGGWRLVSKISGLFNIKEEQLGEIKTQFLENAPRAVFFGRFVALLRIFAGPIAGIAQMPYPQFLLCNFGGATLWASVMVTISFFLGRFVSLEMIVQWMAQFGMVILALVVLWIIVPRLWKPQTQELEAGE